MKSSRFFFIVVCFVIASWVFPEASFSQAQNSQGSSQADCSFCDANGDQEQPKNPLADVRDWKDVKQQYFGECLQPADYNEYLNEWKRFNSIAQTRTAMNSKRLASEMTVSDDTRGYLQDLKRLDPTIKDIEKISKSDYVQKLVKKNGRINPNFLDLAMTGKFLDFLASDKFGDPDKNKDPLFQNAYRYPGNTEFRDAIIDLQRNLTKPSVRAAVNNIQGRGLSIFDPKGQANYHEFMKFFDAKSDVPALQTVLNSNNKVLQSEIPYPSQISKATNIFAKEYGRLVETNSMEDFIWKEPVTQAMLAPHLKEKTQTGETLEVALLKVIQKQVDTVTRDRDKRGEPPPKNEEVFLTKDGKPDLLAAFNDAEVPTNRNIFDEKVIPQFFGGVYKDQQVFVDKDETTLTASDVSQIDMVARTLLGEVMTCQEQGLYQAEAVGMVIAKRSLAVSNSVDESIEVKNENNQVFDSMMDKMTKDKTTADINQLASAVIKTPHLKGRLHYGRPDLSTSLPFMPAAEVVSKNLQFSVWDPHYSKAYQVSQFGSLGPNLPDHKFHIYGPLGIEALKAQIRGLCPEISKNSNLGKEFNKGQIKLWNGDFKKSTPVWDHMLDLAFEIVKNPKRFLDHYSWKPPPAKKDSIYFYTHGPDLPFANPVKVDFVHDNFTGKDLKLRGTKSPCNKFQAFAPKEIGIYEPKTH